MAGNGMGSGVDLARLAEAASRTQTELNMRLGNAINAPSEIRTLRAFALAILESDIEDQFTIVLGLVTGEQIRFDVNKATQQQLIRAFAGTEE